MSATPELLDLKLDLDKFPDELYVLQSDDGRYGCYCHQGLHGLATFTGPGSAMCFMATLGLPTMSVKSVTFDEAREIAKGRPDPVACMMLLDDLDNPVVHYVK